MIARTVEAIAARPDPVIEWIDQYGRLELTGHVFANWVYKTAGLVRDTSPDALVLNPTGPLHWRELACIFAACGSDVPVIVGAEVGAELGADSWVGMVAAGGDFGPFENAEELWVFDPAPLALTTEVEPGDTDYISAVRAYPDVAPLLDAPLKYSRHGTEVTAHPVDGLARVAATSVPETDQQLSELCHALTHGQLTVDLS
ncbi:hypothetical protein QP572_00405 [Brevibacterium sp. UMB10442]|nr:hypothetical protein [Brevibacterium sp. UMB10442]